VARILDKPVYLVTDVALLPLSSQHDVDEAIRDATALSETISDDSDSSVGDTEDEHSDPAKAAQIANTPADETGPYQGKNASSTSVAENVATRNVSFGNFASQWLSRQKWSASGSSADPTGADIDEPKPASKDDDLLKDQTVAENNKRAGTLNDSKSADPKYSTTIKLLPRILRTTKMIFTSGSYYFSYDIDLTKRFEDLIPPDQPLKHKNLDPLVSGWECVRRIKADSRVSSSGIGIWEQNCSRATTVVSSPPYCKDSLVKEHSAFRNAHPKVLRLK